MLLERFAHDGYLWHISVERDESPRRTRAREIGHVNGGHTRITWDGTKDTESLEQAMSDLEGQASLAITAIEADETMTTVPSEVAIPLAYLASLQRARSRTNLGYLANAAGTSPDNDEAKGTVFEVQTSLLRVSVETVLGAWFVRDDEDLRPKERYDYVASLLLGLRWDVLRYSDRCLAVSDAFTAQYGIHNDAQGEFERDPWGAKFGLNTPPWAAQGFTIALTPQIALSLHRGPEHRFVPAAGVNMHTIRSARSFVAFPEDYELASVIPGWADWLDEARAVRSALPRSL